MIEREKKILISKDEYDYLLKKFGATKSIKKQTNYYFDTDDFIMNRQKITCRIRLKDGKYTGIVKQHLENTDCSNETEVEIYSGIYDNAFTDWGLKLQGELITERCILFKNAFFEIVLDKNKYLDTIDYELEIEYAVNHNEEAQFIFEVFAKMLDSFKDTLANSKHYENTQNAQSKSSRFFTKKFLTKQ